MKNIKLLFMIVFSLFFAKLAILSLDNYFKYGFIDAIPYAFVSVIFLCLAGMINKSMRKI